MALFDLGFLADRVKIFSLEDETVNFLLGRSQVDYCLSRALLLVRLKTFGRMSPASKLSHSEKGQKGVVGPGG